MIAVAVVHPQKRRHSKSKAEGPASLKQNHHRLELASRASERTKWNTDAAESIDNPA